MDSQHVGFYAFSYFLPPFALHLPALPTRLLWSVSPSDKFTSLRSSPSGFADKVALVSEFVCQGFECEVSRFKNSLQE